MRIYIINDYEEHGPDNIRIATTENGIRSAIKTRLDEDWPVERARDGYRDEVVMKMENLLAADEPCSCDLGSGWGGLQLHILDTVD